MERLRRSPRNVGFAQLDALLRRYGFSVRVPKRGSHYVYQKGSVTLTIPRHEPVKAPYVKEVLKALEAEEEEC